MSSFYALPLCAKQTQNFRISTSECIKIRQTISVWRQSPLLTSTIEAYVRRSMSELSKCPIQTDTTGTWNCMARTQQIETGIYIYEENSCDRPLKKRDYSPDSLYAEKLRKHVYSIRTWTEMLEIWFSVHWSSSGPPTVCNVFALV